MALIQNPAGEDLRYAIDQKSGLRNVRGLNVPMPKVRAQIRKLVTFLRRPMIIIVTLRSASPEGKNLPSITLEETGPSWELWRTQRSSP